MRLKNEASLKGKLGYLPIEIELDRGSEFQKTITSFIENDLKAGF